MYPETTDSTVVVVTNDNIYGEFEGRGQHSVRGNNKRLMQQQVLDGFNQTFYVPHRIILNTLHNLLTYLLYISVLFTSTHVKSEFNRGEVGFLTASNIDELVVYLNLILGIYNKIPAGNRPEFIVNGIAYQEAVSGIPAFTVDLLLALSEEELNNFLHRIPILLRQLLPYSPIVRNIDVLSESDIHNILGDYKTRLYLTPPRDSGQPWGMPSAPAPTARSSTPLGGIDEL